MPEARSGFGRSAANGLTTAIRAREDRAGRSENHAEIDWNLLATGCATGRFFGSYFLIGIFMARICELTGKRPMKGSIIWRSGKSKKSGGIGTHVTAITKRRFMPNLQRVKAVINGEVRYVRVTASALKKGLIVKAPKRTWKKEEA